METAFAGISGALIGSFLNVVVYRLPLGQSLVRPRSRCTRCDTPVAPRDNVPVLSWLLLRGRCRHCGEAIPARYPAVELLTAMAFLSVVLVRGFHPELLALIPFTAMLIAVAFLVGTVVGLGLVVRYGARSRKVGVPFAPFLALGGLVAMLAGQQLIDLYLDRL